MIGLASFAALIIVFAQGDEAALKKEQAALQGKWTIVTLETAKGKDDNAAGAVLEFLKDGKGLQYTKGDATKKGTYSLNPAGKPKEITIAPADEDQKLEGIYQIDKDMLKICLALDPNQGRPAEFAVMDGKSYVLITLERVK